MFSKTTRFEMYASHREDYVAAPRARSCGLDLKLSGRHRGRTPFLANFSLSHIDTADVLLDHGGA